MPYLTVGEENSGAVDLYYEDHGAGKRQILASPDSPKTSRFLPRNRSYFLGYVFRRVGSPPAS